MVTWYENQYGSGVESSNTRPPLVVIFEDFEGFSAPMLQDLIANLQACRENLPFLLIFGVATTVDVIHRSLPHGTTSKMAIHRHDFFKNLLMAIFTLLFQNLDFFLTTHDDTEGGFFGLWWYS